MRRRKQRDEPVDLHAQLRSITLRVVLTLAGISFAVSAVSLTDLAGDHGIPGLLAWTLPVVLDGLSIAGGLMVFSRTLDRESTKYGWFLVILGTAASIAGNVLHAGDVARAVKTATDGDVLVAQVIAGSFPVAMLAAFEAYLLELKRAAKRAPMPDAPTLEAAVADQIQVALPALGADLHAHLDAALDAQRVHLEQVATSAAPDPAAIVERVVARVDATTRDRLGAELRQVVAGEVVAVRDHLDRQAVSIAQRVDARVDTTVRDQVRAALPGVTEELRTHLDTALETLRAEASATTTVRRLDTRRELRARTRAEVDLDAALEAAYATPRPDGRAWSKRTLAEAVGCSPTKAGKWLAERGQVDARPDATTERVQEAAS